MARKVSLSVICSVFENKMAIISHVNVIILLKRPYISLIIATRDSKCENNLSLRLFFQLLTFTFDPFLQCQVGLSYNNDIISPLVLHYY